MKIPCAICGLAVADCICPKVVIVRDAFGLEKILKEAREYVEECREIDLWFKWTSYIDMALDYINILKQQLKELEADYRELESGSFGANVCPWCGFVGDFWFDRTMEPDESPEGGGMHYRCVACSKNIDYAEKLIPQLEAVVEAIVKATPHTHRDWVNVYIPKEQWDNIMAAMPKEQ